MKDAQKPDHVNLSGLLNRLKEGRFVIPDFQRDFEWKPWDVNSLLRSIFLDYYIGSLLLWKGKKENFEALSCERIYGYPDANSNAEYIVLDGQQRLTAMYYAFTAPNKNLPTRSNRFYFYIKVDQFMDENYDDAFQYDWTKWMPKMLGDPERQYEEHVFPLSVIGQSGWALPNWVQGYQKHWADKATQAKADNNEELATRAAAFAEDAVAFGEVLKGITEQYQISYIELDKELAVEKVCDIFTQINSKGVRLDVFDLLNALLVPKGLQLKHMWRDAEPRLNFVDTDRLNIYVLQVMSILLQGYCSPKYLYYILPGQEKVVRDADRKFRKEVLVPDISTFEARWKEAVSALEDAIKVLKHPQEYGAIKSDFLPYISILPAFASIRAHVKTLPPTKQLDARRKLRHWYWSSAFTNRYSGAVESTSTKDFLDLKAWFQDDAAEPALIADFALRFRSLDLRKETKRGSSVYNGIFNLLVLQGPRDWMTGDIPQPEELDDHHIVPDSWGNKHLKGALGNSILNRTALTADTNRHVIGKKLPNEYLPELIKQNGEAHVRGIFETHFISSLAFDILLRDPFGPDDYEAFIAERQRTIQEAIENLLIKERLDLSPQLRDLDLRIERVEIGLREAVAAGLNGDGDLPSHVMQKVDERVGKALKKNAAMDGERYATLEGKLEYFDLRELQDTITSKALWDKFTGRFANKEALATKFDQLAELRNGIRHSRAVSEVTRMEGEAALLWFDQVLKK
jgi:hypothetical protein